MIHPPSVGPERRRDDDAEDEDGLHHPLLFAREDLAQRRLRGRQERRAARALHHAPQHELAETVRRAAEERRDHEQDDRDRQVVLAPERRREERGHRQHDDVRQDVAGAHPRDLLDRRAEVARHLRQRDVDDRGVEHFHDRGGDQAEQDDPPVLITLFVFLRVAARPIVRSFLPTADVAISSSI